MKRKKSLKNMDKTTKKIIILAVAFIIVIILLNSILNYLENKSKNENDNKFTSIQEILQNYGCTYIKETKSKDKDYNLDIYLKFKYNTFEGDESKERFYKNIIGNIAILINENFRLIDESKDLEIAVTIKQGVYFYSVNGDENYFENLVSKNTLKNYSEESITEVEVNSEILFNLINNNWDYNSANFGTKETDFIGYENYFDEGIKVRKISKKVYNLIFDSKYQGKVVNNIAPGMSFDEIVDVLGTPTYGTKEDIIIGYKTKNFYIFFSENEISIYRNEQANTNNFEEVLLKYTSNQIDIKEFMNELTYIWDDYSEYSYDSNFIKIRYPLKGVQIQMDIENSKNIEIYNNYPNIDGIKKLINEEKVTARLDENLVYLEECDRVAKNDELLYTCGLQAEINTINNESNLFGYFVENNQINFVSKDKTRPNISISESINTGFWYTDTMFIYSVKGQGVYVFDLDTYIKSLLVKGEEDYTFEKFENSILTYDGNKTIQIMR